MRIVSTFFATLFLITVTGCQNNQFPTDETVDQIQAMPEASQRLYRVLLIQILNNDESFQEAVLYSQVAQLSHLYDISEATCWALQGVSEELVQARTNPKTAEKFLSSSEIERRLNFMQSVSIRIAQDGICPVVTANKAKESIRAYRQTRRSTRLTLVQMYNEHDAWVRGHGDTVRSIDFAAPGIAFSFTFKYLFWAN